MKTHRLYYLDFLRIIATLAVIMIHVASQSLYYTTDVHSFTWQSLNFWASTTRWSVPIFVMISGALFLDPKKPIHLERLYRKNIWRIVCAAAFWHVFYTIYTFLFEDSRKSVAVHLLIHGYSHLWFLHMIIGLYLLVPLLRKITASLPLTRYFLLLAVVFSIILPTFFGIYNSLTQYHTFPFAIKTVISSFSGLTISVYFSFTLWFVTYFVAGYYFNHVTLTKKTRLVIYVLAVLGLIVTFLGTNGLSLRYDDRVTPLYSYMSLNVAASALGLFVFIKELSRKIDWTGKASHGTH